MEKPDGIVIRRDYSGLCDLCNAAMTASAAVVTAPAMRLLVEAGFWPVPPNSPAWAIEQRLPQMRAHFRRQYLREEFGDFAVCQACLDRVNEFCR